MKHRIRLGLTASIAVMGNAAQASEAFCADVREVVAAARETPPFSSFPLYSRRVGQLGFSACQTDSLDGNPHFRCSGSPTGPHDWSGDHEVLASWIEQCLPQAVRTEEAYDPSASRPGRPPRIRIGGGAPWHRIHFDLEALRITVARESNPRVSWVVLSAHNLDREGR